MAAKDYSNKICGCWQVIKRDWNPISKSHSTFWKAKCIRCGNEASVRKEDLDKNPRSCNNCKGEIIQEMALKRGAVINKIELGMQFGKLTVDSKSFTSKGKTHSYCWCNCECGNRIAVRIDHLYGRYHSKTISCGCSTESSGEIKIRQILEKYKIKFKSQHRVKNEQNEVMVFDFAILDEKDNIIKYIEYNGKQHYEPVEIFGGDEAFERQKIRDTRKTEYCYTHNINLQWIPYFEFDLITPEYLKLENFLVAE